MWWLNDTHLLRLAGWNLKKIIINKIKNLTEMCNFHCEKH